MELKDFIRDGLEHCSSGYDRALNGLSDEEWHWRPNDEANSIAWIIWHVSRVEDRWLQLFTQGVDQIWIRDGWADRLGIPGDDTGLGWSADQVTGLPRHEASLFLEYMKSIETSTFEYLDGVGSKDFDFVPDRSTFPEFEAAAKFFEGYTIGQGFRQLLGEKTTHMGHVTFLRGLQRGINK